MLVDVLMITIHQLLRKRFPEKYFPVRVGDPRFQAVSMGKAVVAPVHPRGLTPSPLAIVLRCPRDG